MDRSAKKAQAKEAAARARADAKQAKRVAREQAAAAKLATKEAEARARADAKLAEKAAREQAAAAEAATRNSAKEAEARARAEAKQAEKAARERAAAEARARAEAEKAETVAKERAPAHQAAAATEHIAANHAATASAPSEPARPLILLVDDDVQMLRWLGPQLERSGWKVVDADSGASAIERYEAEKPDLVVLDQYMPGVGGLDVARHIRSTDAEVTLLMFSASVDPKVLEEADRLVVHFVSKINLDGLLQQLERLHAELAESVVA